MATDIGLDLLTDPEERFYRVAELAREGVVTSHHGIRYPVILIKGTLFDVGPGGALGVREGVTTRPVDSSERAYFWNHWNRGNAQVVVLGPDRGVIGTLWDGRGSRT